MAIKVLSFDLDGTLVDHSFADGVWLEGMAELYAQKTGLALQEAKETLIGLYEAIGDEAVQWYDLGYWFKWLGLEGTPEDLLKRFKDRIKPYPEVHEVLGQLQGRFRLVLFSNACRKFMETELEQAVLKGYFEMTISSVTDFGRVKDPEAYRQLCAILGVSPEEVVHIGDNRRFDYLYPSSIGITSFFLSRGKDRGGMKNLKELLEVLGDGAGRSCER